MSKLQQVVLVATMVAALLCVFVLPPKVVHAEGGGIAPISACTSAEGTTDAECRYLAITDGPTLLARLGAIALTGGILFLLVGAHQGPAKRSS